VREEGQVPLNDAYSWVKFVHVLAVLGFLAAHGASTSVAFKLRGERHLERIRALLDLSRASMNAMYGSLGILVVAGVLAGLMGGWFTKSLWIWVSLALLIGIMVAMYYLGTSHFSGLRKAAGLPYAIGSRRQPPMEPVSEADLAAFIATGRPWALAAIGFGGIAVIAFLMTFKPF
jgi:uncharacterized membrane protein